MYKLMDKATGETVPTGNIVFTMHREAVTLVGCTSPRHGKEHVSHGCEPHRLSDTDTQPTATTRSTFR